MAARANPLPARGLVTPKSRRGQNLAWLGRGPANVRDLAGSPAGPVPAGESRGELKRGGPGARSRVKSGQAPPGAASRPGIPPVTPRNAAPDRAPGIIEGHQGRTAPILTRDHETSADYGSICSIYPVRFAGSGTAVALLTHDHGPRPGPSRESETEPKFCALYTRKTRNGAGFTGQNGETLKLGPKVNGIAPPVLSPAHTKVLIPRIGQNFRPSLPCPAPGLECHRDRIFRPCGTHARI